MNGTSDQLLTGSGFAENQHAGVGRRDSFDDLVDGAHLLGLAGQLAVVGESLELGRELAVLLLDVELVERLGNECLQAIELVRGEGLLDIVVGALTHRLDSGIDGCLAGDNDALGGNRPLLQLLEQRESVHLGHLEIGEDDAKRLGTELVEGLLAIDGYGNVVAFIAKYRAQPFGD